MRLVLTAMAAMTAAIISTGNPFFFVNTRPPFLLLSNGVNSLLDDWIEPGLRVLKFL
jgi:membrane protease subunit (stomatin/prohibitin family)